MVASGVGAELDGLDHDAKNMFDMLLSGRFSDISLLCGDHVFYVHRVVISAKSGFFSSLFDHMLLVSPLQISLRTFLTESQTTSDTEVDLGDEDPALLVRTLIFVYTSQYTSGHVSSYLGSFLDTQLGNLHDGYHCGASDWYGQAILACNMFIQGQKYDIVELKQWSFLYFVVAWDKLWPTSDDHPTDEQRVGHIIRTVYDTDAIHTKQLRHLIVQNLKICIARDWYISKTCLYDNMQHDRSFWEDMTFLELSKKKSTCQKCGREEYVVLGKCVCGYYNTCTMG